MRDTVAWTETYDNQRAEALRKALFFICSVILGGCKAFGVPRPHWIEFSESGLNEHVRIPAAAGVAWFTRTESSTAGKLGNYLENKNIVGRRGADSITHGA